MVSKKKKRRRLQQSLLQIKKLTSSNKRRSKKAGSEDYSTYSSEGRSEKSSQKNRRGKDYHKLREKEMQLK